MKEAQQKNSFKIEVHDIEDQSFRQKCGEIFMHIKNNLVFICTFCCSSFHKIENFIEHLDQHLDNATNTDDEKVNPLELNNSFKLKHNIGETTLSKEIITNEKKNTMANEDVITNTTENQLLSPASQENQIEISKFLPKGKSNLNPESYFVCKACNKKCRSKSGLSRHKLFYCKVIGAITLKPKDTESKKGKRKSSSLILDPQCFCEICNKSFKSKAEILRHKLSCESTVELPLNIELPKADMMINEHKTNSHSNGASSVFAEPIVDQCQCRYCDRRFKCRAYRIEHEHMHTGEKKYKCEYCEKSFRIRESYLCHLRTHKNIRPYKCHVCDAAFANATNRLIHVRRHLGEKPYKCQYCDMCFVVSTEKKHHERQHTGEKPHQCNECGQCFATGSRLQTHLTKHKGDKKFKCKDCDKSYFTAANLKVHALSHTDERFTCSICDAKFLRKVYLTKHMVLHSDIKPHMCSICGKRFHQRTGLLIHRKTHERHETAALEKASNSP